MSPKTSLRKIARDRLRALPPAERAANGARIADTLWTLPEVASAGTILLYASFKEEVPTEVIAAEARRRGVQVTYPRCVPNETRLTLHLLQSEAELQADSPFGIREPLPDHPLLDPSAIDVALIPGLGWDRVGHRLGRGAGYYDRLLADPNWRALRCGLFFATQEFDRLPFDEWDVRLDVVVTEREVWRRDREQGTGNREQPATAS